MSGQSNKPKKQKNKMAYFALKPFDASQNFARHIRSVLNTREHNSKFKLDYIGGTPDEARAKLWNTRPKLKQVTDSIADVYGIDPEALRYRLNHEGFVDELIADNNQVKNNYNTLEYASDDDVLFNSYYAQNGYADFGLDDVGTLINEGKVKLVNERWFDSDIVNEKNRQVYPALGETNADNIGLTAATLKYHLDSAKTKHPNYSPYDLNRAALIYFNRGQVGGEKYIKQGGTGYKYK